MKTLSLKIEESLDARLTAASRQRGEPRSAVVREALRAYLETSRNAPGASCLDLAADLVGCVEGTGDLSFNKKKHLRGYGK